MLAVLGLSLMPAMVGTFLMPAVADKFVISAVLGRFYDSCCQTGAKQGGNRPVPTMCCAYVISFAPAGLAQHTCEMQKAHVQIMQRELKNEKDKLEGIRTACQRYAVFLCTWILSSQRKDTLDKSKLCGCDVALWKKAQIAQRWLKIPVNWKNPSTTASH